MISEKIRIGVGPCSSISVYENKRIAGDRALILWDGIGKLIPLQEKQDRGSKEEEEIASVVNAGCNCDSSNKFASPTLISFIVCNPENLMHLKSDSHSRGRKACVYGNGELTFFGLVRGDENDPWIRNPNESENKWFLHFGDRQDDYHAPVTGVNNLIIEAYKL